MRLRFPGFTTLLITALLTLTACENSEERAQRHFETGMELLSDGDVSRALIEFRNVFKLNPQHKEARMAYARTQLEHGRRGEAFKSYRIVLEQYPDLVEARIELVEMSLEVGNWEETKRHVKFALEQAPDDPRVLIADTAVRYAQALTDDDNVAASQMADRAQKALEDNPENFVARRLVIDHLLRNNNFEAALPVIDAGLEQQPENYELHSTKLKVLSRTENEVKIGETLRKMVEIFPEDEASRQYLIAWFLQQGDNDGAEAFMRDLANRPDADVESHMAVIQFLRLTKGDKAARAEVDRLVETQEDPTRFIALQATMDFDAGVQDEALAKLEKLVDGVEEPDDVINDIKILLARMQLTTGNNVGARARVEEVIESDNSHVEALKMRAAWLTDEDLTGDAIIDLRTALSQAPRDPAIMTLMAIAHERAGDRELAGERYSLAVELSNQAPAESLRYANFLTRLERIETAEGVLEEALVRSPDNFDLLRAMAAIKLQNKDWNEVQRIIWKLRADDSTDAQTTANAIQAEMLLQQDRLDDTIEYLGQLSKDEEGNRAFAAMVETQVRAGKVEEAVKQVVERLAENPDDEVLRNLRAGLHVLNNERDQAEVIYRDLLKDLPANDRVLRTLYSLLMASDRVDDARQLVDEQAALIDQNPNAVNALLLKAEILERDRDFDGAIAIYEEMYARDSSNMVVANNLASLISTHRDTEEDLNRAYVVARRLRGIDVPALQDTYGWIEYRRGNYEEAVVNLEPAAAGLPNEPLVQYHLGRAYLAVDRKEDAKKLLRRSVELAGENPLPQIVKAREILEELSAEEGE